MGIDVLPRTAVPPRRCSGWRSRLLEETETVFSCLLCRLCEESCPAGVHITENVRSLRHYLNRRRDRAALMALPTGDVIGILADNLRLRGSVLPLSRRRATALGARARPAARRRDGPLHRADVPARPLDRVLVEAALSARRHAGSRA